MSLSFVCCVLVAASAANFALTQKSRIGCVSVCDLETSKMRQRGSLGPILAVGPHKKVDKFTFKTFLSLDVSKHLSPFCHPVGKYTETVDIFSHFLPCTSRFPKPSLTYNFPNQRSECLSSTMQPANIRHTNTTDTPRQLRTLAPRFCLLNTARPHICATPLLYYLWLSWLHQTYCLLVRDTSLPPYRQQTPPNCRRQLAKLLGLSFQNTTNLNTGTV
jgi:hypothetical protein